MDEYHEWLNSEPKKKKQSARRKTETADPKLTYEKVRITRQENRLPNCMQEILLELMNERGLKDVDVVRGTGISWSTWHDWITGDSKVQLLDRRILDLSRFFNVSINYLAFGVGDSDPFYLHAEVAFQNTTSVE